MGRPQERIGSSQPILIGTVYAEDKTKTRELPMEADHMNTLPQLAKLGDSIETHVRHPAPGVVKMALMTPESCAAGNELLLKENSGWSLSAPRQ